MNEEKLRQIMEGGKLPQFLLKCRTDFAFFCNNVLYDLFKEEEGGLKDYMEEWFNLSQANDRILILAPSGFAKTTVLAVAVPIWLAFNNKDLQIMVVSNTMPQARRVLSIVKSTIENNPLLSELRPTDYRDTWSANIIKTSTKCRIFTRPFSENVKGERVDYTIMDEVDSYKKPEIFFDYIIPRLNPKGKIFLITTPEIVGLVSMIRERDVERRYIIKTYVAIVQKRKRGEKDLEWDRKWENAEPTWPERFSVQKLKERSSEMGNQYFEKNYMCNIFTEGENTIYTAVSIHECKNSTLGFINEIKNEEEFDEIYIGVDLATASGPRADFDVYVVVGRKGDKATILYADIYKGIPPPVKVQKIIDLYKRFKAHMVIVDKSGVGVSVISELRMSGVPTEAQEFSPNERENILTNLKDLLDNRKLVIPKNQEDLQAVKFANTLEVELLSFKEKKSETGGIRYVSVGLHDDTVMALAMAVKKIRQHRMVIEDHIGIS